MAVQVMCLSFNLAVGAGQDGGCHKFFIGSEHSTPIYFFGSKMSTIYGHGLFEGRGAYVNEHIVLKWTLRYNLMSAFIVWALTPIKCH